MAEIEVEKSVGFLEDSKMWSITLHTVEPYGEFHPRIIYVTAIFHKNLDKALKMAWGEFNKSKQFQDNNDKFTREKQTETILVTV